MNTIGDKRYRLLPSTLEALECLKSWFRLELFTQEELHSILEAANAMEFDEGGYIIGLEQG